MYMKSYIDLNDMTSATKPYELSLGVLPSSVSLQLSIKFPFFPLPIILPCTSGSIMNSYSTQHRNITKHYSNWICH